MKKVTTLIIIALVSVMILSACATKATETAKAPAETTQAQAPAEQPQAQATGCTENTTLKVLAHQNPPMVEFMTKFNQDFMAKHPNVTVDMSVVNANDLSTVTQTRLTAHDVDVIDIFGFANAAQPYMKNVTPPNWQTLIDAGSGFPVSQLVATST